MNQEKKKGNNETDVQKYFKYAQVEATELHLYFEYSPYAIKKSEDTDFWLIVFDLEVLPRLSVKCPLHSSEVTTPISLKVHTDKHYSKGHIKF